MEKSREQRKDTPVLSNNYRRSQGRLFHEPKINKLKILQDKLEDVKLCVQNETDDINELSMRTQELLIRGVSRSYFLKT
jgi:CRISPR/Cas system CMR subunit Cmr6 (Cas7 group RAMP superfamily)